MNDKNNEDIDELIIKIKNNKDDTLRSQVISKYTPFIIKTASRALKRYIEIENDDEFSIALLAFNESIDKFSKEKSSFLTFSRLVIESRIKDYLRKTTLNIDENEQLESIVDTHIVEDEISLNDELNNYKKILKEYGLNFEMLMKNNPTHKDTRCRCFCLVRQMLANKLLIEVIKKKKKLPITIISKQYNISKRIIKYSKEYILSLLIIYIYEFEELKEYIEYIGGDCDDR
jgi:RNA polymerase sigma factor